ncbi:thermonuclease family protein [Ancylobacter polymorphus]|uniref:Thermonuclease family protein n=1 Tax=Ancylobacter polymorphus TaxID=223390 RepID=A0A9E7D8N3_9HYPH|nr:thermonuclease family protein [Ancylobacter polymorphus]UOK73941.1 thermonuclease family protein [Ancylobacter polymorphus]
MTGLVAKGAVVATLVLAVLHWASRGDAEPRPRPVSGPVGDTVTASFTFCGSARRFNCVVDGDTFWLGRQKIRIADIDAPELTPPRCEYEREVGEAAKHRLRALLNAGPFALRAGVRDEDPFGRKLRMVMRAGRSIGERMVAERLVRRWDGNRRSWCD